MIEADRVLSTPPLNSSLLPTVGLLSGTPAEPPKPVQGLSHQIDETRQDDQSPAHVPGDAHV
jgi:hypothetical protein